MAIRNSTQNPLLSTKPPETPLAVQLHPLVLLTISDYITRHTLRRQVGPVIGAVIGQQNGRSITLEHAYECLLATADSDDSGSHQSPLDAAFFQKRLEQYKEVHKEPQLDLVALFMLGPIEGPQPEHLPVLQQVHKLVNSDAVLLLLFHPEQVDQQEGGKLPLSLYESFEVHTDGATQLRFLERPFDVETGEAEMIGVDFVAKGGGNASAVPGRGASSTSPAAAAESSSRDKRAKSKGKAKDEEEANGVVSHTLSVEDDELISSLTAKSNAVKMLNQRLELIRAYLSSLPKSSLTDTEVTTPPSPDTNFALLRNINAMLSRLPLLAPSSIDSELQQAASSERGDVHLTALLAALTQTVSETQVLGSRFQDVQRERSSKERNNISGRPTPGLSEPMDTSRS